MPIDINQAGFSEAAHKRAVLRTAPPQTKVRFESSMNRETPSTRGNSDR